MWTHNRVKEILTAIKWVVGGVTTYPIYHIESSMNIADIVTKPRQLYMADIDRNSLWQTGMQWMQLPSDLLPKTQVRVPTGEKSSTTSKANCSRKSTRGKIKRTNCCSWTRKTEPHWKNVGSQTTVGRDHRIPTRVRYP
jgi:hypothetical protein